MFTNVRLYLCPLQDFIAVPHTDRYLECIFLFSPKSLVRSAAIQPPVSRNPPLVKARSGSAMSEAPPGPQITVISDPAETVLETVQGDEGRNKRGQGRAERPDTRR